MDLSALTDTPHAAKIVAYAWEDGAIRVLLVLHQEDKLKYLQNMMR